MKTTTSQTSQIVEIKEYTMQEVDTKFKELGEYGSYGIFMRDIDDELWILRGSMNSAPIRVSQLDSNITKDYIINGYYLISPDKKTVYMYINGSDDIRKIFELEGDRTIKQLEENYVLCDDGTVWWFRDSIGTSLNKIDVENVEEIYSGGSVYKLDDGDIYYITTSRKINLSEKFKSEYPNGFEVKKAIGDIILTQDGRIIYSDTWENINCELLQTDIRLKDFIYSYSGCFISYTGELYKFNENHLLEKIETNSVRFEKFCSRENRFIQDTEGKIWQLGVDTEGNMNVEQLFEPTEDLKEVVGTVAGIVGITDNNELYREGVFSHLIQ